MAKKLSFYHNSNYNEYKKINHIIHIYNKHILKVKTKNQQKEHKKKAFSRMQRKLIT